MRTFKCYDCGHIWEVPHGTGGRGIDLACPKCGGRNIHRATNDRGRGGWGRGRGGRGRGRPQDDSTTKSE